MGMQSCGKRWTWQPMVLVYKHSGATGQMSSGFQSRCSWMDKGYKFHTKPSHLLNFSMGSQLASSLLDRLSDMAHPRISDYFLAAGLGFSVAYRISLLKGVTHIVHRGVRARVVFDAVVEKSGDGEKIE